MKRLLLAPIPQRVTRRRGELRLIFPIRVGWPDIPARDRRNLKNRLAQALAMNQELDRSGKHPIECSYVAFRKSSMAHPQAYVLRIKQRGVVIEAAEPAGFHHALSALAQLNLARPGHLPRVEIHDRPDIPVRGVMLDVSRDKVPKMSTLLRLVDWLSWLKINQLQLYTEHTFAYRRHRTVWKDASPFTPAEIRRLDRFCRDRFIELVPNQNCFGHMERWLKHKKYRPLAETNRPWRDPWGRVRSVPSTLCPLDPRSLKLVTGLLDELTPNFTSRQVNVGCDETFELGKGRSKAACQRSGVGRVYLDYLLKLHKHVAAGGRRMQFWADIVHQHPELIRELPRDVIPLEWGYEADHPFEKRCRGLRKAGLDFYVCPGTSSWCSFAGRTDNALANLASAAVAGKRHGATGYLITDWGDGGHRQQLPVSYIPFLYGAAVSWNVGSSRSIDLVRATSLFAFGDRSGRFAKRWCDLGNAYRKTGIEFKNQTLLYRVMQTPLREMIGEWPAGRDPIATLNSDDLYDLQLQLLETLQVDATQRAKPADSPFAKGHHLTMSDSFLFREFWGTGWLLLHAVTRTLAVLAARNGQPANCKQLAVDMRSIIKSYRRTWTRRNRPGGLRDSLSHFERNLAEYRDMARLSASAVDAEAISRCSGPRLRKGARNKSLAGANRG